MEIKIIDKILSQKCFWTIIFTWWVFIGIIVSIFDSSLKHNYIYVFGVNSLLLAQIITYQNLMKKEIILKTSISGTKVNNLPLFPIFSKNNSYLNKWYNISICFVIGLIYFNSNCIYCNTTVFKVYTLYSHIKENFKIRVYFISTNFPA